MFNVSGVGNLVSAPVIRDVNDTRVAKYTVATNRSIKRGDNPDGTPKYESIGTFLNCESWGSICKVLEKWDKGDKIQFSGELEQQNWEKDGEKKSALLCRVDKVKGISTKDKAQSDKPAETGAGSEDVPF